MLAVIQSFGFGGAERLIVSLLPELKKIGIECEVVACEPPYDLAAEAEGLGFRVHRLELTHRWSLVEAAIKLRALRHKRQADLIWGHLYFANVYSALACAFSAVPVAWTLHAPGYAQDPPRTLWKRCRIKFERLVGRHLTSAIVAVSEATAEDYRRHVGCDVARIYNGVPLDRLPLELPSATRQSVRSRFGAGPESFVITVPARMAPEKGHAHLCEALRLLKEQRHWTPVCIVAGEGPTKEPTRDAIAALGLSSTCHVVGALPQESLFELIQASDAVVQPSMAESFGIAAAEAMALGVATIMTDIDGFRELFGNGLNALVIPPAEPQALADAIWRLREDRALREKIAASGARRVRDHFDIAITAGEWATLFQRLHPSP